MRDHDPKEFRKLLLEAIGGRTQQEFAKAAGMVPPQVSRYLREDNKSRPSKANLEKIADASEDDAMLGKLLKVCGYDEPPELERVALSMDERAELNAQEFLEGFKEFTKGAALYPSIESFLDMIIMLYTVEKITEVSISPKTEYEGSGRSGAEYQAVVQIKFENKIEECRTWFVLYFAETKGGKVIILDAAMDPLAVYEAGGMQEESYKRIEHESYVYLTRIKKELASKEDIFNAIFGDLEEDESRPFPNTIIGFGFYVKEVPEKFKDFLKAHKTTFCVSEDEKELYEAAMKADDIREVFADYQGDSLLGNGYEAVIADIMAAETDLPFTFFDPEQDEYPANVPCIMLPDAVDAFGDINDEYDLNYLCDICNTYAGELGITEYGEVHIVKKYHTMKKNIFTVTA